MTDAISFQNLGFAYQSGKWIFKDYSATIPTQSIFAILGPNGCGKTTLLKLILKLLHPNTGNVTVNGITALVPQLFQTTFAFTVLDMVLMGRARKIGLFSQPSKHDVKAAMAALDRFGLAHLSRRAFHQLSGGQRQLLILARALVAEADILVMDEPTSALDLKNQALVLEWISRLSREYGMTVLFTTHHPHHAYAVADNVMLMLGEQKFTCGPAKEVMTEDNLRSLYGIDLKRLSYTYQNQILETFVPVYKI